MSIHEYWIGKDTDYRRIWHDFEGGLGYIDKFYSLEVHLIRLTFEQYPASLPLFNHEAVFKTVKGYFHDLKLLCMSDEEYQTAGPLLLYDVRRDSGIWSFLGEFRQLLLFGTTLADEKVVGQQIDNIEKKLKIVREYFGDRDLHLEDFQQFMRARTPADLEFAVQKLLQQGLRKVEISREPFLGNMDETQESLIDLKDLFQDRRDYLRKLHHILATLFSEQELRTLTFELGIDYENLPGQGKADKARELVIYLARRNNIGRLVRRGSQLRPDISWTDA